MYYYVVRAANAVGESPNSLQVSARPVSSVPANLLFNLSGGQLQFSWPATHTGWRLETQTNSISTGLGSDWFTVGGSTQTNQMTFPIGAGNGSVFFRLGYP
jgi:hypothetical protein